MYRGSPKGRRFAVGLVATAVATGTVALFAATQASSAVLADFPDFSDVSDLKLNGDAEQAGDVLRLTSADADETGTAWTKARSLKASKSFKTEFVFQMHSSPGSPGDGMAFVVHSGSKSEVGDGGGGLGFGSLGDSVAVEFDTFDNGGGDEQANEVAIIANGKAGKTRDSAIPPFDLYGSVRYAWISYNGKTGKMRVWVSDSDSKPSQPTVSSRVKLTKIFDDRRGRSGFTAATGGSIEAHDVESWTLKQ